MKQVTSKAITAEVYTSFVDTFFSDKRSLVMGAALQAVVVGAAWFDTGHPIYLVLLTTMLATALLRLRQAKAYHADQARVQHPDMESRVRWATRWENRYMALSAAGSMLIGLYAYVALRIASSEYSIISATTLVFATLPTVVGRLYGSQRLVSVIVISLLAPTALGAVFYGDPAHLMIALLCPPYVLLIQSLVRNIRSSVLDAIHGRWKNQEIAERFDVALNNMSHGLIMFDGDLRVLVANRTARRLFDIPAHINLEGRQFEAILRYGAQRGAFSRKQAQRLKSSLGAMILEGGSRRFTLNGDRHVEFRSNPRAFSGAVLTFDDITDRINAEKQMVNMARYDALTGLPNRSYFSTQIIERLRQQEREADCVLVMLDVDDFKHVNDTHGHALGDALLMAVAMRLKELRGERFMVSRQGGDEFMVFAPEVTDQTSAAKIAETLRSRLAGVYDLEGEQIHVTVSIGAVTSSVSNFDLTKMMVKADLALYRSKAGGKGIWSVFEDSMDAEYKRRQLIKTQLSKAIENEKLGVRYQPIADAKSGKLVACEALSRWNDADLGDVSPAEYIPLAEEMGMIGKVSRLVLKTAMRDCADWPESVNISINLSAIDFRRSRLMEEIDEALAVSGLSPSRVEIEVTETAVISNEQEMLCVLEQIRKRGIKISLDDFGTGYSSLSYLHRLPLDKVKIDRSFVEGIDSGKTPISLLRGVVNLCNTLGLEVTIEGVSSDAQIDLILATEGVSRIQGYALGPALPRSSILELAKHTLLPVSPARVETSLMTSAV
ncbi:putative bifunctional diguanylate cyclase/phosphodiesterase [Oricola cellulosilytica]|uniref:EAL domain-containing protein n=1 Tax=Oricola cellulosilytica TaxID=1429082 RepID=A0A4R0P447_9HYPH|nr:EAL domain-containing protein [Oricola cellulosilytica]TCD11386.1 EAL domain-containing protein [Oricola cellulosilytica]